MSCNLKSNNCLLYCKIMMSEADTHICTFREGFNADVAKMKCYVKA